MIAQAAMLWRLVPMAALAAVAGLAACDDTYWKISHVTKTKPINERTLWTMQDGQGVPTEIHGLPFRITDAELAAAIRPPAGTSQETQFYARPPGAWVGGTGYRLVLHFNPTAPPNAYHDCRFTAETRTGPPRDKGFSVTASFCQQDKAAATGYLQAPEAPASDVEEFTRLMRNLLSAILKEEN